MLSVLSEAEILKVVGSFLAVASYSGIRHLCRSRISGLAATVRTWCGLALVLVLCAFWIDEIRSALWSFTAVAAAVAIAAKEVIACLTGGATRRMTRAFAAGDRVEIDGVYGEVAVAGLLTTSIDEMEKGAAGPRRTGRRVVVPNARLFAADLRVDAPEGAMTSLAFHLTFDGTVSAHAAVGMVEQHLRRGMVAFDHLLAGARVPGPVVTVETTDMGKVRLDVVCSVPCGDAVAFERDLKMEFLEWLWAQAQERQAREAKGRRRNAVNDHYGQAA